MTARVHLLHLLHLTDCLPVRRLGRELRVRLGIRTRGSVLAADRGVLAPVPLPVTPGRLSPVPADCLPIRGGKIPIPRAQVPLPSAGHGTHLLRALVELRVGRVVRRRLSVLAVALPVRVALRL